MNFLEFVAIFFYFPFIMLIHSEIKKSFFCKTTQYCIDTINICYIMLIFGWRQSSCFLKKIFYFTTIALIHNKHTALKMLHSSCWIIFKNMIVGTFRFLKLTWPVSIRFCIFVGQWVHSSNSMSCCFSQFHSCLLRKTEQIKMVL